MSSIVIPTPFSKFDLLYVSSGYVGDQVRPVYAIKPGAAGDISLKPGETSNASIAWSLPQGGPYNPSPIVYGDYYYTLFDRGFFTCHDARTGKEIYTKVRLDPDGRRLHRIAVGLQRQVLRDERRRRDLRDPGRTAVKCSAGTPLDEFTMASPAIHRDSLLIRTATTLYRIAGRVPVRHSDPALTLS